MCVRSTSARPIPSARRRRGNATAVSADERNCGVGCRGYGVAMTVEVIPASVAGWPAVEAVFLAEASARNCWCQFHVLSKAEAATTNRDSRRELLRQQIGDLDPPRGLVAMDEGVPVGWCGVEPRTRVAHVLASRLVAKNSPVRR